MKTNLFILLVVAAGLGLSCKPAAEKAISQDTGTGSVPLGLSQKPAEDANTPPRYYNFGQKTEFVMAMRDELAKLNRELDALSAEIDRSSEAIQSEAKPRLAVLREKAAKLKLQVEEDVNATLPTWNVMKGETEEAFANLRTGIAQSRQAVTDKVAP